MAVQQRAFGDRGQRERAVAEVAGDELLEHQGARRDPTRLIGLEQRRDLGSEAKQAARLEPDHRDAATRERCQRPDGALRLAEHRATAEKKVLFTTFTRNLAADIEENLKTLCTSTVMQK